MVLGENSENLRIINAKISENHNTDCHTIDKKLGH
jgi:hypothetical protein